MIKVSNLNKYYNKNKSNEIHVINDVTLELPSYGLISFLGASGSGKTTLLNVIGGLDKASGTISYDSFEMTKYLDNKIDKFRNENFGYVFQGYNLLLNETIYDNLKIALELIDIYDEKEISKRIEYALTSVGMYKYRKKKASQLSGGQQQRVAIARALVKHCKLIIADEPTGNLDSTNALEVMNILKSISKKTLVLLVTHNETLANFYSDYIYKIEDGKIINHYENVGNGNLETTNDNVFYLKDMNLVEVDNDQISIKLYSEANKELNDKIEFEIVSKNNTFYIKCNKNIKLIDNNIKLINEHYKPIEKNEIDENKYDDSFFNDSIKKRNFIQDLVSNFKRSFKQFINPTKKTKIIYISLLLIGILFAFCAISISNAVKIDDSLIGCDNNYYALDSHNRYQLYDDSEILKEAFRKGEIENIQMIYHYYVDFSKKLNFVEEKKFSDLYKHMYYNESINSLIIGKAPVGSEYVISSGLADQLLNEFSYFYDSYQDLFDLTLNSGNNKLVGVVDNPYKVVYMSKSAYLNNVTSHIGIPNDYYRYYEIEKKYDTYEIVLGRDLSEEDFNTNNILISDQVTGYEAMLGEEVFEGTVVGVYRLKGLSNYANDVIINHKSEFNDIVAYKYSYDVSNYVLYEGREPQKETECIVSIYSDLKVGETFEGLKIVGRYNAESKLVKANALFSTSALSIDEYSQKVFTITNSEAFEETINNKYKINTMYQQEINMIKEMNSETIAISLILGVICLIAASIMVLFLMRSKMLNDIYNIGVYRSLGSSKQRIYLKYFSDTFIMVSFTSLISYLLINIIYLTAIDSINEYFYLDLYNKSLGIPLLGVLVLYLVNIMFGLLPIYTLLRKTPSEIIAKYDI